MITFKTERVAIKVTPVELYAIGWNGDKRLLAERFLNQLLTRAGYKYSFQKPIETIEHDGFCFLTELYYEDSTVMLEELDTLKYITCPNCKGQGEIEHYTSHSWYENCNRCEGKGSILLEDYLNETDKGTNRTE
jgi:hypothetical protein